jgi:hypothetical protein
MAALASSLAYPRIMGRICLAGFSSPLLFQQGKYSPHCQTDD